MVVLMARSAGHCLKRLKSPEATEPLTIGDAEWLAIGQNGSQHIGARLANYFTTGIAQKPPHPEIPGHNPLFTVNGKGAI
jgi:hypothetical protein